MTSYKNKLFSDRMIDALMITIGIVIGFMMVYPMYFIIIASFSDPVEVSLGRVFLFPKKISFLGYQRVFENARIWTGYRNTILYTLTGTFLSLVTTLLAAFSLSRKELTFRKPIMFFFAFTMFFNGGLIPTYFLMKEVGLLDNPLVMIIPFSVNVYNLIIARTFFSRSIAEELFEASKLDGSNYTNFFIRIVLPLSKPIIAVLGLYYAVGYWNEFFKALIYIRNPNLVPLQLVLREILISNMITEAASSMSKIEQQRIADIMKYSLILISTVPVMAIYPFVQKHFAKGIMLGSLKG